MALWYMRLAQTNRVPDWLLRLGTFPLVFPNDAEGHARKETLLAVYDRFAEEARDWERE